MPQITQLPVIFWSQLFWLLLIFGALFFVIGRGMVPKILGTVEHRDRKISDDLEQAQKARDEAESTEAEYRERIEASRAEAMKLALAAKQDGAREAEERNRAVDADLATKADAAEAKIRQAVDKAMAEIDAVAAEATRQMVVKLTGKDVREDEARKAVEAVTNG
ncbi:ATPase [Sphingomonas sabuli]|uniref:ATP synthase subunit b n=1 Tax=Sphingomonas sabuli TaxID=2764186 RepID=A0A7G9L4I0_9SPHN|nr:ATPase [Sphingomonas sabuli]QNM83529.1 ATPase [Sphingomonas sabuli]